MTSPFGSRVPIYICILKMKVKVLVAQSCLTFCDPTDCRQVPLSTGFPKQEYWNGLPFLSPGDPPAPGIKSRSPALQQIL